MLIVTGNKHQNYELLNLIGYGLAKFNNDFIKEFGAKSKSEFYEIFRKNGIVDTSSTVKNRQDLFDAFLIMAEKVGGKRRCLLTQKNIYW